MHKFLFKTLLLIFFDTYSEAESLDHETLMRKFCVIVHNLTTPFYTLQNLYNLSIIGKRIPVSPNPC